MHAMGMPYSILSSDINFHYFCTEINFNSGTSWKTDGLSQILWKASHIIVLLRILAVHQL